MQVYFRQGEEKMFISVQTQKKASSMSMDTNFWMQI